LNKTGVSLLHPGGGFHPGDTVTAFQPVRGTLRCLLAELWLLSSFICVTRGQPVQRSGESIT